MYRPDFMLRARMAILALGILTLPPTMLAAPADAAQSGHTASFHFVLEVEGVAIGGFQSVSGLSIESEVVEYRDGSDNIVRKLPGRTTYSNITLKRGYLGDDALHDWIWANLGLGSIGDRRDGALIVYRRDGGLVARYAFSGGWPCRWEGPSSDPSNPDESGNAQLTETIVICFDWLDED